MTEPVQLVIAATSREADAVLRHLGPVKPGLSHLYETRYIPGVLVAVSGIGLAEAAAATAHFTATQAVSAVFSLGVAGGHQVPIGHVAIGQSVTRADTGIEEADGQIRTTDEAIGQGNSTYAVDVRDLTKITGLLPKAVVAHVLTVATVTGTAARADRVLARRPSSGPAVEDMESWGALAATRPHGLPFFAIKAVSNAIGPRDRSAWDLDGALDALSISAAALFSAPADWTS